MSYYNIIMILQMKIKYAGKYAGKCSEMIIKAKEKHNKMNEKLDYPASTKQI